MGGEWFFYIKRDVEPTTEFDLPHYHAMLRKIRKKVDRHPSRFESVLWAVDEDEAAATNVFATFRSPCVRHDRHAENGATWKLFWDPRKVPANDRKSDIHARCISQVYLKINRLYIQSKIEHRFPSVFEIYLGDGISGYEWDYNGEYSPFAQIND